MKGEYSIFTDATSANTQNAKPLPLLGVIPYLLPPLFNHWVLKAEKLKLIPDLNFCLGKLRIDGSSGLYFS